MTTPLSTAAVNVRTIWETEYTGLRTSIVIGIITVILPYIYRVIRRLLNPSPLGPIILFPSKADSGTDRASDAAKISRDDETSKEDIPIDIFAIHGLGAHALYTWTTKASKAEYRSRLDAGLPREEAKRINWLKDFLPEQFPAARVVAIGHNANWFFMAPVKTAYEAATNVLREIKEARKLNKERRPIILIGHSFGGIVIKEALIQARDMKEFNEIFDAIFGVLFLGTPHQGSKMSWAGKLLAVLTTPFFGSSKMLLRALEYHEDGLISLQQQFSGCLDKTDKKIYAFYESLPTKFFGVSVGQIVDKTSSLYNSEGIDLNKDHSGMNKFREKTDSDYRKIVETIRDITVRSASSRYLEEHKLEQICTLLKEFESTSMLTINRALNAHMSLPLPSDILESKDWFLQTPEYRNWSSSEQPIPLESQFLWYTGRPNIGKTATAAHIVQKLQNMLKDSDRQDVVFFFCSPLDKNNPHTPISGPHASDVLCSVISQLLVSDNERVRCLKRQDQDLLRSVLSAAARGALVKQAEYWHLLGRLIRANRESGLRIVIEGLHHIHPEEEKIEFVKSLRDVVDAFSLENDVFLKVFVTSLSHDPIAKAFEGLTFINPANEVAECLNSIRPSAYNVRQESVATAYDNTSDWIWEDPEFVAWAEANTSNILWLVGKAGSGKSTLLKRLLRIFREEYQVMSIAEMFDKGGLSSTPPIVNLGIQRRIKGLPKNKVIVASFFYSLRGHEKETSHQHMLLSILYQVLKQEDRLFSKYRETFLQLREEYLKTHHLGTSFTWPFESLKAIFLSLLDFRSFPLTIYLFIDAVDESESPSISAQMLLLLREASRRSSGIVLKCIVTSRPEDTPSLSNMRDQEIDLHTKNQQDIEKVIDAGVHEVARALQEVDPGNKYPVDQIRRNLSQRADGVILWVSLVLKELQNLIISGAVTVQNMEGILKSIPDELDELYARIISGLCSRKGDTLSTKEQLQLETKQWLQLAAYSGRLFSIEEFRDAVIVATLQGAFDGTNESLTDKRWPIGILMVQRQLVRKCGGFVEVRALRELSEASVKAQILRASSATFDSLTAIQLLHQSVKDFLQKEKATPFKLNQEDGNRLFVIVCILYLQYLSGSSIPISKPLRSWDVKDFEKFVFYLHERPLLDYVLTFLPRHLRQLNADSISNCETSSNVEIFIHILKSMKDAPTEPGFYILASWLRRLSIKNLRWFNSDILVDVVNEIDAIYLGQSSAITGFLETALVSAAHTGRSKALKILLAAGANKYSQSALQAAAIAGHFAIAEYLGTQGPESDIRDSEDFEQQRERGQSGDGQLDLPSPEFPGVNDSRDNIHGADVDPLIAAARAGKISVVKMLLERGLKADARDSNGRSAAHWASVSGHSSVISLLQEYGSDLDSKDADDMTPLLLAAAHGNSDTVLQLIKIGVDMEVGDNNGLTALQTALQIAAVNGHEAVIRVLLEHGANDKGLRRLDGNHQPMFMVPFSRSVAFVGRMEIFQRIDQIRSRSKRLQPRIALVGLGGVGKSSVAVEFSYRCRETSPEASVFWVYASTFARFEADYRNIAERIKLPGFDAPKTDILSLVKGWLESSNSGNWLLILDNLDDVALLNPGVEEATRGASITSFLPEMPAAVSL